METSLSAVRRETRRFRLWMGALTALLLVLVVGALGLGRYGISPHDTVTLLLEPLGFDAELEGKRRVVENLLFQVRLPRIALAILAGAGLSAAGAAFQALFANPLASPDTLGVATGASFRAVLGILCGATGLGIQFCALASGLLSVFLVLAIARVRGESGLLMMILAGMVVAALFTALISLVKYVADPQDVLPQITFWLMGALSGATVDRVLAGAPLILLALVALELFAWRLNVTTLTPDEELAPDEVRIDVRATGLNFRDVMWTMGLLPEEALENGFSGPSLGLEAAGVVRAVGRNVTKFVPGDAVVAFGPACFSTVMTTKENAVAKKPETHAAGLFVREDLGRVRRRFRDVESARIDLEENDFAKARAVQFQGRARDFAGGVVVDVADRDGFRRGGREAPRAEERGEREAQFLHRYSGAETPAFMRGRKRRSLYG